jgi:benzoate membrane transport protein
MLTSEEAGPDKDKRYTSAIVCGVGYLIFGLFAGLTTAFVSLAPAILIESVAGLALIAAFSASAFAAFSDPETRPAAAVTFLATASGMSLFGISGAFWGLLGGGLMLSLTHPSKPNT